MTTTPLHPAHADKIERISGANPRLTAMRVLEGYAYPQNGNVHNPTPRYGWLLLADGRMVGRFFRRCDLVTSARDEADAWLADA